MSALGGPNTPIGKAIASRNSTRHGLTAQAIVLPDEASDHWEAFSESVADALTPVGPVEEALAARVAELFWRLRRVSRAERDAVYDRIDHPEEYEALRRTPSALSPWRPPTEPPEKLPMSLPAPAALNPIMRYESHLNRQLLQTLHELEAIQDRRQGHPAPLARLDITLPGQQ